MDKIRIQPAFNKMDWKGKIMTVNGLLPAEVMDGYALAHDHLINRHQGPDVDIDDIEAVIKDMKTYYELGGRTIIEQSNERIGRDPKGLKRISTETGVNVIMGCGYYKEAWMPFETLSKSIEEMAQEIYNDIVIGVDVDGERIHAGHIGEIGVSRNITETEERSLRASVRAQNLTGAAISIHFDLDALPSEHDYVVSILEDENADPRRIVINHIVSKLDNIDEIIKLTKKGYNITLDHFSLDVDERMVMLIDTPFEEQMVTIKELLRLGLIDHLMLSQDTCFKQCLTCNGGKGYTRIINDVIPYLRKLHVNEYDIDRITIHNARKVFTLGGRFPSY